MDMLVPRPPTHTSVTFAVWRAFLELMSSVYPGYKVKASFGNVIVETPYDVADGKACKARCLRGI
jgi:hypothetical protein